MDRFERIFAIDMIQKMTVFAGTAACAGLIAIFVPAFGRDIAADVLPFSKMQLGSQDGSLVISPPDIACRHEPWPYGCDWRAPIGRKQIAKTARTRHPRYVLLHMLR